MAALSTGFHKKLKDLSVPVEERVKLARYGWISSRCFLPNKHQVLLDWVCASLANVQRDGILESAEQALWLFLHDSLKSQALRTSQQGGKPVCVKGALCAALTSALKRDELSSIAIGCSEIVLTNEKLRFVQTTKLEAFVSFAVACIELAAKKLDEAGSGTEACGQLLRVTGRALAKSSSLLQQHQHSKKTYILFCEQLLIPSLKLHSRIRMCFHDNSPEDSLHQTTVVEGCGALTGLIRELLFSRNMSEAYQLSLTSDEEQKQKKDGRIWTDIVTKFMDFLQSQMKHDHTVQGLPVLFSAFLSSYKPSPDLVFAMLRKLCGLMSVASSDHVTPRTDALWDVKLSAVEKLLQLALQHQCYSMAEVEETKTKKMEWFRVMVSKLLAHKRHHPAWYGCLRLLFSLDHHTLATRWQGVWQCLLATHDRVLHPATSTGGKERSEDDVEGASPAGKSRDALLNAVMETYTKLSQLDKLVKSLLTFISAWKGPSSSISFPSSFHTSFGLAVESLTPNATVALWDILLLDMMSNHLPGAMSGDGSSSSSSLEAPPSKRVKRSSGPVGGDGMDMHHTGRLGAAATVLNTFMMNAKFVEVALVGQVKDRVVALFNKMADEVLKPMLTGCHGNQNLVYPTLLLCHGWGALQLILRQHTTLLGQLPLPVLDTPLQNGDVHFLHYYADSPEWLKVMSLPISSGHEKVTVLKFLLLWQQARGLSLHGDKTDDIIQESIVTSLTHSLSASLDHDVSLAGTWDGQVESITHSNRQVALLSSLLRQSSVLLSLLDANMCLSLARLVCQAFCQGQASGGTRLPGWSTARDAALGFLCSEACRESRQMQNAIVDAVGEKLLALLPSGTAAGKGRTQGDWEREVRQQLKQGGMRKKEVSITDESSCAALGLIEVIRQLPILHLTPRNQIRCLLSLALLDRRSAIAHVRSPPGKEAVETGPRCSDLLLGVASETRRLLASVLRGVQSRDVIGDQHLKGWFSAFLQDVGEALLQEHQMADGSFRAASEELVSIFLKKATRLEDAGQLFTDYLKQVCTHVKACLQKVKAKKKLASLPGPSTLLSIATILLHQCAVINKHEAAGAESKDFSDLDHDLVSDLESCVIELLTCVVTAESKRTPGSEFRILLRAVRHLLISKESSLHKAVSPQKVEDTGESQESGDTPTVVAKAGKPLHKLFTMCCERSLSICDTNLGGGMTDEATNHLVASCLEYLATYCTHIRSPEVCQDVWRQLHAKLGAEFETGSTVVRQQLEGLLIITLTAMGTDHFRSMLQQLLSTMDPDAPMDNLPAVLQAWQLLTMATLNGESYLALTKVARQVIQQCQLLMNKVVQERNNEGSLVLPLLSTVASFVSHGTDLLSAEAALPTMHLCVSVHWTELKGEDFPECFPVATKILNDLLKCFPGAVLRAIAAYISAVNCLISALMQRFQEEEPTTNEKTASRKQLVTCAEAMQRLLSLVSSLKADVSQYGVYLLAEYISGLQRATLPPEVKTPLLEGVHKVVDVCDDKMLSLLHVTLPANLKEIFKSFYADYKKHHKYTGHV